MRRGRGWRERQGLPDATKRSLKRGRSAVAGFTRIIEVGQARTDQGCARVTAGERLWNWTISLHCVQRFGTLVKP
jgi:hypothetical protein